MKICVYCSWCPLTAAAEHAVNSLVLVRNFVWKDELPPQERVETQAHPLICGHNIEHTVLFSSPALFSPGCPMATNFARFMDTSVVLSFVQTN